MKICFIFPPFWLRAVELNAESNVAGAKPQERQLAAAAACITLFSNIPIVAPPVALK